MARQEKETPLRGLQLYCCACDIKPVRWPPFTTRGVTAPLTVLGFQCDISRPLKV